MNCKQGKLAVIVNSIFPENVGIIVEVVEPYTFDGQISEDPFTYKIPENDTLWVVHSLGRKIVKTNMIHSKIVKLQTTVFVDSAMKPLEDKDGEDEILRRVGKPLETV